MPTTPSLRFAVRRKVSLLGLALGLVLGGWVMTAQAFFSLGMIPGFYVPQWYYKHGAVYTRAIVPGPTGRPVYVEYDSSGKEAREIGEAVGQYERAQVMSGDVYRAYLQRQKDTREHYPTAEVMAATDYRGKTFKTVNGDTISKPTLSPTTLTVMVRPAKELFTTTGTELLLLELPIKDGVTPDASSKSLLLSTEGAILNQTANTIGFRVGFFGKDGKVSDTMTRDRDSQIYGAMPGVGVSLGGYITGGYALTDREGKYSMQYYLPACPGFTMEYTTSAYLELQYKRFNPRGGSMMPYYMTRLDYDFCNGLGVYSLDAASIIATAATPIKRAMDFPVDLMVLDGASTLKNAKVGAATAYSAETSDREKFLQEKYDFDGDEKPDFVVPGKKVKKTINGVEKEVFVTTSVEQAELQGIYLSSSHERAPANTEEEGPDFTRLIDVAPDFKDRGLLDTISKDDLKDTDIYVFRESNGQLVAERRGLHEDELYKNYSGVDEGAGAFRYTIQLRGSVENVYALSPQAGEGMFKKWQSAGGFKEEFQKRAANHLKAGEQVRIIAINRPTGYIGSTRIQLQSALSGNMINLNRQQIEMAPPNLKIWAERKSKIEKGMTKGDEKKQLIGNEGAGLGSDISIAIYSDWRDSDGSPLPEELADYGFTGRLAKIVAANQLAPVGANNLSQFKIKPGQQVQVIQLPEKVLAKQHLYLQVAGQPENRNPDFSSKGNASGILKYRPSHYVPVQVPLHDEETSELARQAYSKANRDHPELDLKAPKPLYSWQYRPEMQFSLFDLNVKEVRRELLQGEKIDVLPQKDPVVGVGDKYLSVLYDLVASQINSLENWSGSRDFIIALGQGEVKVNVDKNQTIRFDNIEKLAGLDTDDFLTLRLYTNNDMGNLLWEYAFNQVFMFPEATQENPIIEISADNAGAAYISAAYFQAPDEPAGMKWGYSSDGEVTFTPPIQYTTNGVFETIGKLPTKAETTVKVYASDLADVARKYYTATYKVIAGAPKSISAEVSGKAAINRIGELRISIDVKDAFGNAVEDGTPLNISSDDLEFSTEGTVVTANGKATVGLKGGFKAGEQNVLITAGAITKTVPVTVHDVALSINMSSNIEIGQTVPVTVSASSSYGSLQGLVVDITSVRGALPGRQYILGSSNAVVINMFVGDFIGEGRVFATFADRLSAKNFDVVDSSPVKLLDRVIVSGVNGKGSFDVEGRKYEYTPNTAVAVSGKPGEKFTASLIDYLEPPLLPNLKFPLQQRKESDTVVDSILGVPARVKNADRVLNRFQESVYAYDLKSDSEISLSYSGLQQANNVGFVLNLNFTQAGQVASLVAQGLDLTITPDSRLVFSRNSESGVKSVSSDPLIKGVWHRIGAHLVNGQLILQVDTEVKKGELDPAVVTNIDSDKIEIGSGVVALVSDFNLYNWDSEKVSTFDNGTLESSVTVGADGKGVMRISASYSNVFASIEQRRMEYWAGKARPAFTEVAYAAEGSCKTFDPGVVDDFQSAMGSGEAYTRFLAECALLPKIKKAVVAVRTEKEVWRKSIAIAEIGAYSAIYIQLKITELQIVLGPQCLQGAFTGDVDSIGSAVCDIITSFFLIGDLRDFALHSKYQYWDKDSKKFDFAVYTFAGLGIAADLASLGGVGIPANIGLAGAKAAAKAARSPFTEALARYLDRQIGGDITNADKLIPAIKIAIPLLQVTAAVVLFKDDAIKVYDMIMNIRADQIYGVLNYVRFALEKLGAQLVVQEQSYKISDFEVAYALDKKTLLQMLGGSAKAGDSIKLLIDSMQSAERRAESGELIAKGEKSNIGPIFADALKSFGTDIENMRNKDLIDIVSNDTFLSALIHAQYIGEKSGRSSQEVIDSIRRFHCTPGVCGWAPPAEKEGMLKFFALFDKLATHPNRPKDPEAIGSMSDIIRDMGRDGDKVKGTNTAKGATETFIQMMKMMDDGWELVRAEGRFLDNADSTHVHDLVMKHPITGEVKYVEVKNWRQTEDGKPLSDYLWYSMNAKPAAGETAEKVGQLHVDLVRAFEKDVEHIDVEWVFGNLAGDVAKLQEGLINSSIANPQRLLVILEKAQRADLVKDLKTLIKNDAERAEIALYMQKNLSPVLKKIMVQGATLAQAAK